MVNEPYKDRINHHERPYRDSIFHQHLERLPNYDMAHWLTAMFMVLVNWTAEDDVVFDAVFLPYVPVAREN